LRITRAKQKGNRPAGTCARDESRGISSSTTHACSLDNKPINLIHMTIRIDILNSCVFNTCSNAILAFTLSIMSLLQRAQMQHSRTKSQATSLPFCYRFFRNKTPISRYPRRVRSCFLAGNSCHTNLIQTLQRSQAQCQALRATSYADEPGDRTTVTFLLNAQVGQSVLTWFLLAAQVYGRAVQAYRKHSWHTSWLTRTGSRPSSMLLESSSSYWYMP